ncbi:hypothetical protein FQA39_LY07146 [Lamprigera yunnana]|nr:hypothetical protein FQA39_LY07146 [Lamprigera yunnana]
MKVYDLAQNVSHERIDENCTNKYASDSDSSVEDNDDDGFSLFEGDDEEEQFPSQLLSTLKEKFHQSNVTLEQKMQILTLLPNNWSVKRAAEEMNTSRYFIKNARNIDEILTKD